MASDGAVRGKRPLLVALRPLGIGDLLTGIPALRGLAAAFPRHRRVLAAPAYLEPLAALSRAIDSVHPVAALSPLPEPLHGSDVAVDLHGRGPASHRILLASRPERLIGFACPEIPCSTGFPPWIPHEHEVFRWCRMLAGHGVPCDPADLHVEPAYDPGLARWDGATLVHPGAAAGSRRWPPERFAAVAIRERSSGRPVVVTGGPSERGIASEVASLAGLEAGAVLAGTLNLGQLSSLVAQSARVVSGDTGVAHLATACGTPSVVLFGPIPPSEWGPPPQLARHVALWSGRRGDPHGDAPDPGLLRIGVDEVVLALEKLDETAHERPTAQPRSGSPDCPVLRRH